MNHSNCKSSWAPLKKWGKDAKEVTKKDGLADLLRRKSPWLVLLLLDVFYLITQAFQNAAQWGKNQLLGNTKMEKLVEKLGNCDVSQF